jgi:hypothetical protein
MIAEYTGKGKLPRANSAAPTRENLQSFLDQAQEGDYIAIQAYLLPTPETGAALNALRDQLRDRYHLATTTGYGPRFLHSTGQLHKGDAGNGLFVQLIAAESEDVPIPEEAGSEASSISFGVLIGAQALGDWQALRNAGRRVLRLDLGNDVSASLAKLV